MAITVGIRRAGMARWKIFRYQGIGKVSLTLDYSPLTKEINGANAGCVVLRRSVVNWRLFSKSVMEQIVEN